MSILYTANIDGKLYINDNKKEFEERIAKAQQNEEEIEDRTRLSLDMMEMDELKYWHKQARSKSNAVSPSAVNAIKAAIKELEEDGF
ncbi:hypothetical protein LJC48_04690 [Desulfovibrio sp. OttesenSCG-928-C06]|nr:hypothetical protein [Desulfovibrio sp. OttesenSCG-928-C06]